MRCTEARLKLEANITNARVAFEQAQKALNDHRLSGPEYSLEDLRNSNIRYTGELGNDQRFVCQIKWWQDRGRISQALGLHKSCAG